LKVFGTLLGFRAGLYIYTYTTVEWGRVNSIAERFRSVADVSLTPSLWVYQGLRGDVQKVKTH